MTTLFQTFQRNASSKFAAVQPSRSGFIFTATASTETFPFYKQLLTLILWQMVIFVSVEVINEVLEGGLALGQLTDILLIGNVLLALGLLRHGRMHLASVYAVLSQLLFTSLEILLGEAFTPLHVCKFAIVIVITCLLFEARIVGLVVTISSAVTLFGLSSGDFASFVANPIHQLLNTFGHSYILMYVAMSIVVSLFARHSRTMFALLAEKHLQLEEQVKQREQAENTVHQLNETLESRVRQRTVELSVANQELESFAYSVSHDLRAPLRGIDGWSLALLEDYHDKLDDEGRGYLAQVRKETQRMSELIDDILELSRITRSEMRNESVDLSQLAHTIAQQLQRHDPLRQVEIVIQPNMIANGDSHLLRQVLENLLSNAWKFTGKKDYARIEFGCENGVYFVRDDGVGFDMAYAGKLFKPFQRLHRVAEYDGTGVGLAIVQRIVRRHCGEVWAESRVNQGTTFYFKLEKDQ